MENKLIDGKALANKLQESYIGEVNRLKEKGVIPKLVVILVGDNKASKVYVRNKERAAEKIGIISEVRRLPESTTEEGLLKEIDSCNDDKGVHGLLVQLPLPTHISEKKVIERISPEKDVDGFHPMNLGYLLTGQPKFIPCTPLGIIELLKAENIELKGKNVVVIGRSNIVGKPMAQLLTNEDATVTLCHSRTKNLREHTLYADILIVAVGKGHFIDKTYIKPGGTIIDVGMNRDENGKLIGDVNTEDVLTLTGKVTPVPGGVGPMTITMLMKQTIESAKRTT